MLVHSFKRLSPIAVMSYSISDKRLSFMTVLFLQYISVAVM